MDQDSGIPIPPFQDVSPLFAGPVRTLGFLVLGAMSHGFYRLLSDFEAFHAERLHDAVENRPKNTGLVTVMNHASVVDEPALGAVCKFSWFVNPQKMRWTLAAEDFCFKYPIVSTFFKTMKAVPIKRGAGLEQPAVYQARGLVQQGEWLHIYPEGKVSQDGHIQRIRRGVARVIESDSVEKTPILVPIFVVGIQDVVPLGTWLPRPGRTVTLVVGPQIPLRDIVSQFCSGRLSREQYDTMISQRVEEQMMILKTEADAIHARRVSERKGSWWDFMFGKQTRTYGGLGSSEKTAFQQHFSHNVDSWVLL
eukprot:ANDGO_00501.mRNA.1 Tafazzin homolog